MGIRNLLPEPVNCDHCNSTNIRFVENKIKIHKGKFYNCWLCLDCEALVSCHYKTRIPLGYMTDISGRRLRKDLHLCFDKLWQLGYMSREEAYKWLAIRMLKPRSETHISRLSKQELRDAMVYCKKELDTQLRIKERKEAKAEEKRIKSYERHRKQVRTRKSGEGSKSY